MQSMPDMPPSLAAYNSPGLEQSAPRFNVDDLRVFIIDGLLFALIV